ncbi:MAG: transglycosylase SLT domain-containing protein [Acetobacteraceae bacterium]
MLGAGQTSSRLFAARAMLAGVTFISGATASIAHAQDVRQAAMAVPRLAPPNGAEVALPQPLLPSQAAAVRLIFSLQTHGRIAAARKATEALSDRTLVGTILAERYLGPYTVTTPDQLLSWLRQYRDQALAPEIYELLLRKLPRGAERPPPPNVAGFPPLPVQPGPPTTMPGPVAAETDGVAGLAVAVADRAGAGQIASALALIRATRGLTAAHVAVLKAIVARALFTQNEDQQALALAGEASHAAGKADGAAAYIAGLAAWRLGRIITAREFFRAAANADDAEPALVAAAAFWMARAELHLDHPENWLRWIQRAAAERGCFYGLLAARMLGFGFTPEGGRQTLGEADVDAVAATNAGWRAFALLEVGEPGLAEAEFATLWPAIQSNRTLGRAVMLIASRSGMFGLASRLADLLAGGSQQKTAGIPALPLPPLAPAGGFTVDPALVYALTRLESNFNAGATSAAGAHGLMQLMPSTAAVVAGHWGSPLENPAVNLELGQRYITYLAAQGGVQEDLLKVLGSYNGGPGNFESWARSIDDQGDPLLFIEAIPNGQTRHFVEAALAYTWIYAERLGLPAPSLDALAAGHFPRFTAETDVSRVAIVGGYLQ